MLAGIDTNKPHQYGERCVLPVQIYAMRNEGGAHVLMYLMVLQVK